MPEVAFPDLPNFHEEWLQKSLSSVKLQVISHSYQWKKAIRFQDFATSFLISKLIRQINYILSIIPRDMKGKTEELTYDVRFLIVKYKPYDW